MLVYDAFNFWKELDLLEIRLNIMEPFVDCFVLVESPLTFSGKPKPLYFKENRDRFKNFKIVHYIADENPEGENVTPWDREIYQRNAQKIPLSGLCLDQDWVISGDLDEIPDMRKVMHHIGEENERIIHPMMNMYYYYLNLFKQENWMGSAIWKWEFLKRMSMDSFRNLKQSGIRISNAGWHWSFLGNSELIKEKIESFSHTEYDNPFFKENVFGNRINGKDLFFRNGEQMTTVPIDNSFPEYIVWNQEKLHKYIRK